MLWHLDIVTTTTLQLYFYSFMKLKGPSIKYVRKIFRKTNISDGQNC